MMTRQYSALLLFFPARAGNCSWCVGSLNSPFPPGQFAQSSASSGASMFAAKSSTVTTSCNTARNLKQMGTSFMHESQTGRED
ncbi:hypothetical protein HDV64DRAFT_241741 [Trichoderma sp. TUCIM 5745]